MSQGVKLVNKIFYFIISMLIECCRIPLQNEIYAMMSKKKRMRSKKIKIKFDQSLISCSTNNNNNNSSSGSSNKPKKKQKKKSIRLHNRYVILLVSVEFSNSFFFLFFFLRHLRKCNPQYIFTSKNFCNTTNINWKINRVTIISLHQQFIYFTFVNEV